MSGHAERPATAADRLLYSVDEAADLLGIGRTFMFRLIATGEIDSLKIGRRRMIPSEALERYIERLRSASAAVAEGPGALHQLHGQHDRHRS
jgi:excisionase family DNA binding protein